MQIASDYSENSRRLWLSKIPCWKSFRANFDAAGKFLTDFPAARNAIPAKVWALSGKENGCWKIGRAFGKAAGFSLRIQTRFDTYQIPFLIMKIQRKTVKRAPNTALRLTQMRERKLAAPPFRLFRIIDFSPRARGIPTNSRCVDHVCLPRQNHRHSRVIFNGQGIVHLGSLSILRSKRRSQSFSLISFFELQNR